MWEGMSVGESPVMLLGFTPHCFTVYDLQASDSWPYASEVGYLPLLGYTFSSIAFPDPVSITKTITNSPNQNQVEGCNPASISISHTGD